MHSVIGVTVRQGVACRLVLGILLGSLLPNADDLAVGDRAAPFRCGRRLRQKPDERIRPPVLGEVEVITPRFVRTIHKHNLEIHAWTINETAVMERLLATGIDGIITDRPDLMLEWIGR